jgi:hypothetical protein
MGDSYSWKQGARPGTTPSPATPPAAPANRTPPSPTTANRALPQSAAANRPAQPASSKPAAGDNLPDNLAGRIVHDERGNAVWDWLKDTARIAIDSTSRLLRKLEVPELKVEDTQEQELRVESDRDAGGGYDPYGGSGSAPGRMSGGSSSNTVTRVRDTSGSRGSATNTGGARGGSGNNLGGGYDPYGKGITKATRKR